MLLKIFKVKNGTPVAKTECPKRGAMGGAVAGATPIITYNFT